MIHLNQNLFRKRQYENKLLSLETLPVEYPHELFINEKYHSWQGSYVKKPENKLRKLILSFLP